MAKSKRGLWVLLLLVFMLVVIVVSGAAYNSRVESKFLQSNEPSEIIYRGTSPVVHFDVSPRLDSLPPAEDDIHANFEIFDDLDSGLEGPLGPQDDDPIVQDALGSLAIPTPLVSFDTIQGTGATPPDSVGDVGPEHYVVMSNVRYAVYDKQGNLLLGPLNNNTLWSGFGGNCETNNSGDPIVVYDQLEDRWLLSQFTTSSPEWYNCVALSKTGDPTGEYYRWAVSTGNNFPDYPKYGVWSDSYLITTREFVNFSFFGGSGAYVLNKAQMLAGNPNPTVISYLITPGGQAYLPGDGILPADIDGNAAPPANSPIYFAGTMDQGGPYGAPEDAINLWELVPDWGNPGNSTFTLANTLPITAFDSVFPCSPGSRSCIPQPETSNKIDFLNRQRPLFRLAYRNFGTHESLTSIMNVEAGPSMAGMRWWEVRDPGGSPVVYQEGTYAPGLSDGIHRWMGSMAMDKFGNIALGFSASKNTSVFPSIWYTGRLAGDPLGQMTLGEASIIDGTGSQIGSQRWGDYSSMNVDPVDDCTFWYINEYYKTNHSFQWTLRVGAFQLPGCDSGQQPFNYYFPAIFNEN